MRLGQLARKLTLKQIEIVDFLASRNIQIEDGSNTRVEDEHADLVMAHFAPNMVTEVKSEPSEDKEDDDSVPSGTVEKIILQRDTLSENLIVETTSEKAETEKQTETTQLPENPVEIIRAPKVELPGLKVIGKIEISEPKKKDLTPKEGEPPVDGTLNAKEDDKSQLQDRRAPQRRREREERPRRNPIALQREREAMEAEQKKREQAEREKEKRTRNYLKKVKVSQPIKPARLVNEQVVEMSTELNDIPKTWWGRFKRWLTT